MTMRRSMAERLLSAPIIEGARPRSILERRDLASALQCFRELRAKEPRQGLGEAAGREFSGMKFPSDCVKYLIGAARGGKRDKIRQKSRIYPPDNGLECLYNSI